MANPFDLSVLISQMPRVQKLQGDLQSFPGSMQNQMAREVIEKQKREQQEVPKTEKGEGAFQVQPDQERRQSRDRKEKDRDDSGDSLEKGDDDRKDQGRLIDVEV
jgi:hypothetical protein